jgi:hypothetical protein
LAKVADLTPRKRKLYERIRNKESALCKLKRKCKAKKLENIYGLDSDPVMEKLSSSLSVEAARLLAAVIRNSRQNPREGGGLLKTKCWLWP